MDDMSPARWRYTHEYLGRVFGVEASAAGKIRARAAAAGLPPIAVSTEVGTLLTLLARLSGARLAVEIGTLGGYSAWHIARGLGPGGRLVTVERDPRAADVARESLRRAGVGDRVRIEVGPALEVLPRLAGEVGPRTVGLAFLDADKAEYAAYWAHLQPLLADGGLLIADNVLGTNRWWIDQEAEPGRRAVDAFNRAIAADPELETTAVLARHGLLLARRRRPDER